MGRFLKLLAYAFLFSPILLSASLPRQQIVLNPIIIHTSLKSCGADSNIEMHKIPGWGQAYQIVPDCRAPSTRSVDNAFHLFLDVWKANYGDLDRKVEDNMKDMIIIWSRDRRFATGYRENGEYFEDLEVVGLTSNKGFIWVSLKMSRGKICNSSLVHELVHASIWALKDSDGDPDHLGPIYDGWDTSHSKLIDDLNKKICMLGL